MRCRVDSRVSVSITAFLVALLAAFGCSSGKPASDSSENTKTPGKEEQQNNEVAKKTPPKTKPKEPIRPMIDSLAAIKKLESVEAELTKNDQGNVTQISFPATGELSLLAFDGIVELKTLVLSECDIPESFLNDLANLSPIRDSLKELDLSQTNLTDAHLNGLERFSNLESLKLTNTKVGVSSLTTLGKLAALRDLDLAWTRIDGELTPLKTLEQLESLGLAWTDITLEQLQPLLKQWPKLQAVDIEGSAVLDGDMESLAQKSKIRWLGFNSAAATPGESGDMANDENSLVGKDAFAIEGKDLNGKSMTLASYRGKVVLLDFWGHWCPHCRDFYEDGKKLATEFKDQPFVIVGVNSDAEKDVPLEIMKKEGITWSSWWDGGLGGEIASQWQVEAWPTLYLIDKKGVVRHKNLRGKQLNDAIKTLIAEE